MRSMFLRRLAGIAVVLFTTSLDIRVGGMKAKATPTDCSAGKPYCYETPVHLSSAINTPGFEGKPSLSADGLELYFVSDRPGALGGLGDQDIYVSRRTSVNSDWARRRECHHRCRAHSSTLRRVFRLTACPSTLRRIDRVPSVPRGRIFGSRIARRRTIRGARL